VAAYAPITPFAKVGKIAPRSGGRFVCGSGTIDVSPRTRLQAAAVDEMRRYAGVLLSELAKQSIHEASRGGPIARIKGGRDDRLGIQHVWRAIEQMAFSLEL
jgi:hypothetical protein